MALSNSRSEEHTSELQSQSVISYAVFCLKKIFFNDTATTEIYTICYTLSLHDALPISTYIITPYNVDILGDLIDERENNGLYF